MSQFQASELVGLIAYDGEEFNDPFRVTAENIQNYQGCEEPDGGWVMLWRVYEEGIDGFYPVVH